MITAITYPTAAFFWLSCDSYDSEINRTAYRNTGYYCKWQEYLDFAERMHLPLPVHIMTDKVPGTKDNYVFHLLPKNLPLRSFVRIDENIYVLSPEACFLMAANELSVPLLALMATELCAMYVRDRFADYLQHSRKPVTTTARIRNYLEAANNVSGIKKARRAIKYSHDNSNSPMESVVSVLLCLPFNTGGYAARRPKLNLKVYLSADGAKYLKRSYCTGDIVWPEEKVICEYDSKLAHLSADQHDYDKRRLTALTASGYNVISITPEQLRNRAAMDSLFMSLRKTLGMRPFKKELEKYQVKRWAVIHELFQYSRKLSEISK